MWRFCLLFFLLFVCIANIAAGNELLLVQIVWRHGDRAPVETYPNDVHGEDVWPNGFGELTELGMRQQCALGEVIREHYINRDNDTFLSRSYNSKEVYIRSTDVNRTIISAMSNLAGMYPSGKSGHDFPDGKSYWPSHWTPVPVHTVPTEIDHVGNVFAPCPRADELSIEIANSAEYKAVERQYHDLLHYASINSGKQYKLSDIYMLHDTIYIEKLYNMSQPSWVTPDFIEALRNVSKVANEFTYGISKPYVPELIKLRGGPMLGHIIDLMEHKIACATSTNHDNCKWISKLKYYAYSAHDTTVAALLSTFGDEERVIRGGLPHYTASVSLELWNVTNLGPAVKILFHSAFHHDYKVITDFTKGCPRGSDFCPLDVFVKRSQKFVPKDIKKECGAKNPNATLKNGTAKLRKHDY
uniref:Lysosomal acid phosphatase n=1 Tax=Panagrellus redivivus TaxID=6233 RepID=A0A7E4VAK7_PANRE